MKDVFYETPRLPMFFCMEEMNLVRVRAIRYTDGEMDGVLADWDVNIIQTEFYPKEHWNEEGENPFYCIYKQGDDWSHPTYGSLKSWAEEMERQWEGRYSSNEILERYLYGARFLGCPIFDSAEEANAYIFQRR